MTATFSLASAATAVASGHPARGRGHAARGRGHTARRRGHHAHRSPDQVLEWNGVLQHVLVAPGAQPASIHPTRTMAITEIAAYDAVVGIRHDGRPLLVDVRGPRD